MDYFTGKRPKPSVSDYEFKMMHTFETRQKDSTRIVAKYPDKAPLIVEKSDSSDVSDLKNNKWIIRKDLTIGQLMYIIKKRIKFAPEEILIVWINNKYMPSISETIGNLYNKYVDKDGWMYITYSKKEFLG